MCSYQSLQCLLRACMFAVRCVESVHVSLCNKTAPMFGEMLAYLAVQKKDHTAFTWFSIHEQLCAGKASTNTNPIIKTTTAEPHSTVAAKRYPTPPQLRPRTRTRSMRSNPNPSPPTFEPSNNPVPRLPLANAALAGATARSSWSAPSLSQGEAF